MYNLLKILGAGQAPPQSVAPPAMSSPPVPSAYLMGPPQSQVQSAPGKNDFEERLPQIPMSMPPPVFAKPSEGLQSGAPPVGPFSTYVLNSLSQFYNVFQNLVKIPKNATNTVYVEGIPSDTTEREVARKSSMSSSLDIFRPFPGYKCVRLIPRETKTGERVLFCFADFENTLQSTLVINTLQV